jgi:hypothetical protein
MVDYASYPTGTTVGTQTSGMSPEMEAKFLWYLDNVVKNMKEPFAGQGPIKPQEVVGFTDAQNQAMASATDPEGYKPYLNQYQDYVTKGITDQFDQAINQANLGSVTQGAFGGERQQLMTGILQGEKGRAVGDSLAQGFGQAHNLWGQGVARLMGAGSIQQQQQQQQSDANYQSYLQNRMDPYQRLGYIGDAFSGTPSGQMAMTMGTAPVTNPLSQALGAGLGIMGLGTAGGYMT